MANLTFKGNPIHTNGELPKLHSAAPSFTAVDVNLKEKTLNEFTGKLKLIAFVPSLDTDVCSLSAKKFDEAIKKHSNAVCLIISCDLPFAQKRVCASEMKHLTPLSLMHSKKCAEDYGVLIVDGPLAGLCARAVVVLDEHHRVLYTELIAEVTQEPNYQAAIKALGH